MSRILFLGHGIIIHEEGVTESESDDSEAQESKEDESHNECEVIGGKDTVIPQEETEHKR